MQLFPIHHGNAPKLEKEEWFRARSEKINEAKNKPDRKRMMDNLEQEGAPLWKEYEADSKKTKKHSASSKREWLLPSRRWQGGEIITPFL